MRSEYLINKSPSFPYESRKTLKDSGSQTTLTCISPSANYKTAFKCKLKTIIAFKNITFATAGSVGFYAIELLRIVSKLCFFTYEVTLSDTLCMRTVIKKIFYYSLVFFFLLTAFLEIDDNVDLTQKPMDHHKKAMESLKKGILNM